MSPKAMGADVFGGSIVALPTPFRDGALDAVGIDTLVAFQARDGSAGIAVGGTVGEGGALSIEESEELVARAVASAATHSMLSMRVLFEIEEDDPNRSAELARRAVARGAEGLYVGTHASDDARLEEHVAAIEERLDRRVPIALMAGPFSAIESDAVVARCQPFDRPSSRRHHHAASEGRALLTANDRMLAPAIRNGAIGALTAVGNLVPAEVRALMESAARGERDAERRERALAPLIDALRSAPPPVAVKEALAALDAIQPDVRAPLASMNGPARRRMKRALEAGRLRVPN